MSEIALTDSEIGALEEAGQQLSPGYRLYNEAVFQAALEEARYALREFEDQFTDTNGEFSMPLFMRHVLIDPAREGYGAPFPMWWCAFDYRIFDIEQDPWSEVKWWIWEEIRGQRKNHTMHGCQNCLAPETRVRMYDGGTKRADAVIVGDVLMGDDSTPRHVLSTCSGMAPMVRVSPKVGKSFVCTENHLVTVVCKRGSKNAGGAGSWSSLKTPGRIYDIKADELTRMKSDRLQCYGLKSAVCEYHEKDLPFDPYIYGLWLGDGTKSKPEITGCDEEILQEWESYFRAKGYAINRATDKRRPKTQKSSVWFPAARNFSPFKRFIESSIIGSKIIRREYLLSSRNQRLQLLAGLIDTDGYLSGGVYYVLTCSDPALMDGYEELVQSLGFRTSRKKHKTNYTDKYGAGRWTEKISICGDISTIPVRLARKKKIKPQQARGVRKHGVSGFTVEKIGEGKFAGFEVDGNHRFLLEDFTITHNSAKTSWCGRFGAICMSIWFEHTRIYVSGPFKNASEDKIWGDSLRPALQKMAHPKNKFAQGLAIKVITETEDFKVISNRTGNVAEAKFIALENAAQAQGKKAVSHTGRGLVGVTLLMVDEFIENPGIKLAQVESNYSSNHNYLGLLLCNPLPQKVQHPSLLRFSQPNKIDTRLLNKERDFRWSTAYGLCSRYAWQNCPNRIVGRTVWPYLLNLEMQQAAREKADELIAAQIDAWAWSSSGSSYLDMAAVEMAGTFANHLWEGGRTRLMHIDCAFGGADPATATILEGGEIMLKNEHTAPIRKQSLAGVDQIILPVSGDFQFTREWYEEMLDLFDYSGGSFPDTLQLAPFKIGQMIPAAWSLAHQTLKVMRDWDIPQGNVTFDASQRADCVEIMKWALGRHNVRYYYEGTRSIRTEEELTPDWYLWPAEYEKRDEDGKSVPKRWSDICNRPISMIWMFACNFIRHGHLINGNKVRKGIDELIARPIEAGKKQGSTSWKRDVLSKEKLIDLGQKSPTYGEGLATGIYFAVRFLGLSPINRPELIVQVNQGQSPLGLIRAKKGLKFSMNPSSYFGKP